MSQDQGERIPRSASNKDTLPSQTSYAPSQRSQRRPICVDIVDMGRIPTVPDSQRVTVIPGGPASTQPCSVVNSVRTSIRPDSEAPSTQRSSMLSSQLTNTPASKVLSPFRKDWTGLKAPAERDPEFGQLRRYVSDIASHIDMAPTKVYVLRMKQFVDQYDAMPSSLRSGLKSKFTSSLDECLTKPVSERLANIIPRGVDVTMLDDMPEREEFLRVIRLVDDTAGELLPPRILNVARDLLLLAISARAFENKPAQNLLTPFVHLLEDGHLAVGLTKERRFMVITL